MKNFSRFLSIIFNPLLMPTYGLFLIFSINDHILYMPMPVKKIIFITVFVSSVILPLSITPLLYILKQIQSIYMKTKKERIWPLIITGFFFFTGYYFLSLFSEVPAFILRYILATIITIYMALFITFFWKISIHMIGIGGLTGGILALAYMFGIDLHLLLSLLILIAGLLGVARLYLAAHNPAQIYAGFVLGFVVVFSFVMP